MTTDLNLVPKKKSEEPETIREAKDQWWYLGAEEDEPVLLTTSSKVVGCLRLRRFRLVEGLLQDRVVLSEGRGRGRWILVRQRYLYIDPYLLSLRADEISL
jgi:hypothetical protein